jgi:hypothetical protein
MTMPTWMQIVTAVLVVVDLVATKFHWTKTKEIADKVETLLGSK